MVKTTENQICSSSSSSSSSSSFYVLKPYYLLGVALLVVVPCFVLTSFLGFGWFYPILFTTSILILSTNFLVIITKKMRKVVLLENPGSIQLQVDEDGVEEKVVMESGVAQEADIGIENEFQGESLDLTTSESERTENVELSWVNSGKTVEQNPEISYDSASESEEEEEEEEEEEGLIEIAIPSNDSNGLSEESKSNSLPNFPLPGSISSKQQKQQDLVELLAEMNEVNEEENLIEIDISMGSIK